MKATRNKTPKADPIARLERAFSDAYGSMMTYALLYGTPPADTVEIIGRFFGECKAARALFVAHTEAQKKPRKRRS